MIQLCELAGAVNSAPAFFLFGSLFF